jgi:hypothetical protein
MRYISGRCLKVCLILGGEHQDGVNAICGESISSAQCIDRIDQIIRGTFGGGYACAQQNSKSIEQDKKI